MEKRRQEADRRARQSQRLARTLRVFFLIQERHGWNLDALARELNCSRRTIQRDLDVLEACGIPWFYDDQRCCYRVRPGYRLPLAVPTSSGKVGSDGPPAEPENVDPPSTPADLAASSPDTAERLLQEAERLIHTLTGFCQTLRQSAPSPPGSGQGRAK